MSSETHDACACQEYNELTSRRALEDGAEIFPAQLVERVPAHGAEGGIHPLHEAVRAGHHHALRRGMLRMIRQEPRDAGL